MTYESRILETLLHRLIFFHLLAVSYPRKRNSAPVSANEFCVLLNVLHSFEARKSFLRAANGARTRELLAEMCGVGEDTAKHAITMYKDKEVPEGSKAICRPKLNVDVVYDLTCRRMVSKYNKRAEPLSSATLATELVKGGYASVSSSALS